MPMKATKKGNRYQITYRAPGSKKIYNETFQTLEEANLRIAQIQLEKKQGTFCAPTKNIFLDRTPEEIKNTLTVEALMGEYVNLYGLNNWSERTLSNHQHHIRDYILPFIGDMRVRDITTHKLESFYQHLLTVPSVDQAGRKRPDRCVSATVIQKVHALIRSALNQAIRWDYMTGPNPAMPVQLPKYKSQPRASWDAQEALHAIRLEKDPLLHLAIMLALGCSMRIGEILGLTWDCVHMEDPLVQNNEAFLHVNKELMRCTSERIDALASKGRSDVFFTFPMWKKTPSSTRLVLKSPKTDSSVRDIYLPDILVSTLRDWKSQQDALKQELGSEYQDFNLVMAQNNGRPVEATIIGAMFQDFIRKNDLKPVVFHSLRHSSTSLKLRISGGNIKAVQGDTGHAQATMVTERYAHIIDDDRRKTAQQFQETFYSGGSPAAQDQQSSAPLNDSELLMQLLNRPELIAQLKKLI